MKTLCILGATAALVLAAGHAGAADKQAPAKTNHDCFSSRDWGNWSTSNDGDVLYLRVNNRQVYQIDLAKGSHVRKEADNFLISQMRGSDWICSAQDLDLMLSDHQGFKQPLFPKALRKLTLEEVAAIPKKDLP
jgi:hypothetical protein